MFLKILAQKFEKFHDIKADFWPQKKVLKNEND